MSICNLRFSHHDCILSCFYTKDWYYSSPSKTWQWTSFLLFYFYSIFSILFHFHLHSLFTSHQYINKYIHEEFLNFSNDTGWYANGHTCYHFFVLLLWQIKSISCIYVHIISYFYISYIQSITLSLLPKGQAIEDNKKRKTRIYWRAISNQRKENLIF